MDFKYKQLEQELTALGKVFAELGARLSEVAKEVAAPGVMPSEKLLEQISASRTSFENARTAVHGHASAMLVSPLPKLGELVSITTIDTLLKAAAVAEETKFSIEGERERALAILGRVLSITHRETGDFKPLQESHAKIGELRNAVSNILWPHRHPESEAIVASKHPTTALLHFVENLDKLDDDSWMMLETTITDSYGKPLFVAASRGKLEVRAEAKAEAKPAATAPPAPVKTPEPTKPPVVAEKPVEKKVVAEKAPEKPAAPEAPAAPVAAAPEKKTVAPVVAVPAAPAAPATPVAVEKPQPKPVAAVTPAVASVAPTPVTPAPVASASAPTAAATPAPPSAPEKKPLVQTPAPAAPAAAAPVVTAPATPPPAPAASVPTPAAPVAVAPPSRPPAPAPVTAPPVVAHVPVATPSVPAVPAPVAAAPTAPAAPASPAPAASNGSPAGSSLAVTMNSLSALATATEPTEKKPASTTPEPADKQRKEPRLAASAPQAVSKPEPPKAQEIPEPAQQGVAGDGSQRPQRWGFWRGNR